jgi:hypothetical protein
MNKYRVVLTVEKEIECEGNSDKAVELLKQALKPHVDSFVEDDYVEGPLNTGSSEFIGEKIKPRWVEDECCRGLPGHEDIAAAWERIFGEKDFQQQWDSVKSTEEDGGDAFTRTMPNGVKVIFSCEGWSIE